MSTRPLYRGVAAFVFLANWFDFSVPLFVQLGNRCPTTAFRYSSSSSWANGKRSCWVWRLTGWWGWTLTQETTSKRGVSTLWRWVPDVDELPFPAYRRVCTDRWTVPLIMGVGSFYVILLYFFVSLLTGLERQLGSQAHDGAVWRGKRHLQLPVSRLQSGSRIHRWIHFPVDALQRSQPDSKRRTLPQTDWRLVVNLGCRP